MTEAEWHRTRSNARALYTHVRGRTSARKILLIGVGCCRLLPHLFTEPVFARALTAVERFAEGAAEIDEFADAREGLSGWASDRRLPMGAVAEGAPWAAAYSLFHTNVPEGVRITLGWLLGYEAYVAGPGKRLSARFAYGRRACGVVREVVGNPFRPWQVVPDFLGGGRLQPDGATVHITSTTLALADGIHAEQAFDRLPILADALEEAGVTDPALLAHCRTGTNHVRGCWALDVVRGKA